MIQIIAGEKGKGKTKIMIEKANEAAKTSHGSIVYLDKSNKNMYDLNRSLRLINVKDYLLDGSSGFLGFICGMLSQNHDIETIFIDSFLNVSCLESDEKELLEAVFAVINKISDLFDTNFVISISVSKDQIPANVANDIIAVL